MTGDNKARIEMVKESTVSHHIFWSFCMISLMLGLVSFTMLLNEKNVYWISLFFLFIAVGAIILPLNYLLVQVVVASVLTGIVLNQGTQPSIIQHWLVDTFVYLVIGIIVNQQVGAIRKIQRHNEEMAALAHISTSLTKTLELSELTNQVVDNTFSLFQADGCTIFLMDEGKRSLNVICARERDADPEILRQIINNRPRVGFGLVGYVAATGESILSGDAEHDHRAIHIPGTPFDEESVMVIPLKGEGEIFGVLLIYKLSLNAFNYKDLQLSQIFANQISVALANARLYEHVRSLSATDGLTGLLNSRSLLDLTERAINHAVATKGCVSILFIDCDDFKGINDQFGHPMGDKFLRFFANLLLEGIREGDVVIRYAGDEFVILLPNTTLEAATRIGERIIEMIREQTMDNIPGLHSTVSIGLATYPEHAVAAEDLIKHADDALYTAKRNGKDQLRVYVPDLENERKRSR